MTEKKYTEKGGQERTLTARPWTLARELTILGGVSISGKFGFGSMWKSD
jgi:hypothetical protein